MTETSKTITRTIALARPPSPVALAQLGAAKGVLAVHGAPGGRGVEVSYDLHQVGLREITGLMTAAGLVPAKGLLTRIALGWAAFQEDNQRAQAKIVHQCCNTPPDGP